MKRWVLHTINEPTELAMGPILESHLGGPAGANSMNFSVGIFCATWPISY